MKKVILFFLSSFLVVGLALNAHGQASSEPTNDPSVQQQESPATKASVPSQAGSRPINDSSVQQQEPPSTGAILGDFIFLRPFGIVATAFGVVGTVITLPIAIPSGSTGVVAQQLIAKPFAFTFTRPLGTFPTDNDVWP
jgi:hypothetical protein